MREDTDQVKVAVPIKDLWRAMSTDIRDIAPKILPGYVVEVELLEGDGGQGSVINFILGPAVPNSSNQKEKIVEVDEYKHQVALELLEGGHLDHGFTAYTTVFKLTAVTEAETLIDIKVLYETKPEYIHIPGATMKATFHYINCLQNHLSNNP